MVSDGSVAGILTSSITGQACVDYQKRVCGMVWMPNEDNVVLKEF